MSGQERLVALTLSFEGFEFGGHIDFPVAVVADIKRYDADGVAGNQELVAFLVVEHKGKDAAEGFEEGNGRKGVGLLAPFAIEREDDFTVAARLKLVLSRKATANLLMVVYLAIDGEHLLAIR